MLQTDHDLILTRWDSDIEGYWEKFDPRVRKIKQLGNSSNKKITIWLGGPGKKHILYPYRLLLKETLEKHNFEVVLSENLPGELDLTLKELDEIYTYDIIFLLIISPGTSGEAIEFAHEENIRSKMWFFFPRDFSEGFVYRSLKRKRLLVDDSMFDLKEISSYSSVLVLKILDRAYEYRRNEIRKNTMQGGDLKQQLPENSITNLSTKIDALMDKLDDFSIKINSINPGKTDIYEEIVFSVGAEFAGSGVKKLIHVSTQSFSYAEIMEDLKRFKTVDVNEKKEVEIKIVQKFKEYFKKPEIEKIIKDGMIGGSEDIFLNP